MHAPHLLRAAPKVLLHDHLDGGLRSATIVELAAESGYGGLPTTDPDDLAAVIQRGADRRSLELYLDTFVHTVGVMQTPDALARVARECAEDLAADGVVHAEIRFAPELHTARGLTVAEVLAAVLEGFAAGPSGLTIGVLVSAMRTNDRGVEAAELALRHRDDGVVGFDIAGPEAGFPPTRHEAAFALLRDADMPFTIHAGESAGVQSIAQALACGAKRLGHGVRLIDDVADDGSLGPVAAQVHARGIALELCPTSNVHTGAVASVAAHPFDRFRGLGFTVTVNTDNRLMSGVTASSELGAIADAFDLGPAVWQALTEQAVAAAFLDEASRTKLLDDVIRPRYAALDAGSTGPAH